MKKENRIRRWAMLIILLFGLIFSALLILAAFGYVSREAMVISLWGNIAAGIAVCVFALMYSLKKTVYSYKNIMFTGGVLFLSTMLVAFIICFMPMLFDKSVSLNEIYSAVVSFPRQFSYYAVFVIIAVCAAVLVSNIVLMKKEGVCLGNALSLLVAALYIGGTFLIWFLNDVFFEKVIVENGYMSQPVTVWINTSLSWFLLIMLCYFECVLAGTAVMGYIAARQIPTHDRDYIIILGCSIDKKGGLLPLLKGRVNRAIRFAWEQEIETGKPLKYIPSGGQGKGEILSEGSAMELYLLTKGAEQYEVLPEKKSVNTYENILFSKRIIDAENPDAKVAFATTNYHMLRSGIIAQSVGLDAQGVAGDTKWYFWPNGFVREFFGILVMNVRVHVIVAAALAFLSAIVGAIGYISIIL